MGKRKYFIAGIGELLWDVTSGGETLGGAPANVAYHISALGGQGAVISSVGSDERGRHAVNQLAGSGVDITAVSTDSKHETGYVLAQVDGRGVASYTFPDDVAWDFLRPTDAAIEVVQDAAALCFGTLAQRSEYSRQTLDKLLSAARSDALIVYDVNLRHNFYSCEILASSLRKAYLVKVNDDELAIIGQLFDWQGSEEQLLLRMIDVFDVHMAVVTRGDKGSLMMTAHEVVSHPGQTVCLRDTIGAGDAFTAALILGLLSKRDLDWISDRANLVAAYLCSQKGAMPDVPAHLRIV